MYAPPPPRLVCCGGPRIVVRPTPVYEYIRQRPVIREKIVPRYRIKYQPTAPETSTARSQHIVIVQELKQQHKKHQKQDKFIPQLPPPPPPPTVHCHCPPQQVRERRPRSKPRPARSRSKSAPRLDMSWINPVDRLSDDALLSLSTLTAAALSTATHEEERSSRNVMEVDAPSDGKAGDVIEVRVPAEAGGGTMRVRLPVGIRPGETFEVRL